MALRWDNSPVYRRRRRMVAGGATLLLVTALGVPALLQPRSHDASPIAAAPSVSPSPTPAESESAREDAPKDSYDAVVPPLEEREEPRTGKAPDITIAFAGDTNAVGAAKRINEVGLGATGKVLAAADVSVVNLETVVAEDRRGLTPEPKKYTFATGPEIVSTMQGEGVDVLTAANNHGMDFGEEGMRRMLDFKARSPIPIIGIGADEEEAWAPWETEVDGRQVFVFGATDVLERHLDWKAGPDQLGVAKIRDTDGLEKLLDAVKTARAGDADAAIAVYLHAGIELERCATPRQQELAVRLANAGADVVVQSHAHRLQAVATLGETAVSYGMGNFVFGAKKDETRATGVLTVTVPGAPGAPTMEFAPARITEGIPELLEGSEQDAAITSWQQLGEGCS